MVHEQQFAATEPRINNDCGISPETASNSVKERLFVGAEAYVRNANRVPRKLRQAPRYFNPPEWSWLACNECGENDTEENIHKAKRKPKPCFICGVIGHKGTRCRLVSGCFICSKKGHLAITCPTRHVKVDSTSILCLLCGVMGHEMFSCSNSYDPEDLKAIECYICRKVGHLCCADNKTEGPTEASCYKCGESGHFGLECAKLIKICPKCGESGHSRKQCTKVSSVKVGAVASARTARRNACRARNRHKTRRLMAAINANEVLRPQIAENPAEALTSDQHVYHHARNQIVNYSDTLQSASSSILGFQEWNSNFPTTSRL